MGSYWVFSVGGYSVLDGKNVLDDRLLLLFRETDLQTRSRHDADGETYYSKYIYRCSAKEMRERLDLMGFTSARAKEDFNRGVRDEIDFYSDCSVSVGDQQDQAQEKEFLAEFTYEKWVTAFSQLIREKNYAVCTDPQRRFVSVKDYILHRRFEGFFGFFASDYRFFLRACTEAVSSNSAVTLDLQDLIAGGFYTPEPNNYVAAFAESTTEYARISPILILTEGSTDKWILESTLRLVYPHLTGFFSFADFEQSRAAGGAASLVATMKGFIGSGIRNRIVGVFDNDTAARVALRGLKDVTLPSNMAVFTLPNLKSAKNYPTIGPQGTISCDLNGLACSIELFFGHDVLGYGQKRLPIRWTGLDSTIMNYQGELLNKNEAQDRFKKKLRVATATNIRRSAAWADIRYLWKKLKEQSEKLSPTISFPRRSFDR